MVTVAQSAELWIVAPAVVGSSPIGHPFYFPAHLIQRDVLYGIIGASKGIHGEPVKWIPFQTFYSRYVSRRKERILHAMGGGLCCISSLGGRVC